MGGIGAGPARKSCAVGAVIRLAPPDPFPAHRLARSKARRGTARAELGARISRSWRPRRWPAAPPPGL
eukprot:7685461-Alexandrium_andersonii.AAC.1